MKKCCWFRLDKRVDDIAARMAEHLLRTGCRRPVCWFFADIHSSEPEAEP